MMIFIGLEINMFIVVDMIMEISYCLLIFLFYCKLQKIMKVVDIVDDRKYSSYVM